MKKFLLIGTCLLALSACQAHNPQTQQGALVGALAGGLLGNTVGKGTGKTIATGVGAVLGTLVGQELAGGNRGHQEPRQRTVMTVGNCNNIANAGARAACERGVAERDRIAQRQAEQRAYQCGRYGRCD